MATEVSICNQALSWLGANTIISLNDDTTEAKLAKANYTEIRDSLLEAHDWTFATKWRTLPRLATTPESEYASAFELPPEVLRVIFSGTDYNHQVDDFQIEDGNLMQDQGTCKIKYVYRVTDPSRFSSLFVQALAARLAADWAIPLTNSRSLMESHFQVYEMKLREAVRRDGMQGKSRRIRSRWMENSRAQGPRGFTPGR